VHTIIDYIVLFVAPVIDISWNIPLRDWKALLPKSKISAEIRVDFEYGGHQILEFKEFAYT
jgi:hypothetical protein